MTGAVPEGRRWSWPNLTALVWMVGLATVVAAVAPAPFDFGYLPGIRTWVLYVAGVVTLGSVLLALAGRDMVPFALIAPFFVQYYQVALGWEVPLGSLSPFRLMPLAGVLAILMIEVARQPPRLSRREMAGLIGWEICCVAWVAAAIGTASAPLAMVTWTFNAALVPAFYFVFRDRLADPVRAEVVLATIAGGFLVLVVASVAVSFVALDYRGSTSLLSARNANDGNLVLGYLILAWPIAVLVARRRAPGALVPLGLGFVVAAALMFSRAGLVVVPVLVMATLILVVSHPLRMLAGVGVALAAGLGLWTLFGERLGLADAWLLRLNVGQLNFSDVWAMLASAQEQFADSGRGAIWDYAVALFRTSPIIGGGFNSFEAFGPGYGEAHSLFFQTLGQRGVIGVAAVYGLLGWVCLGLVGGLAARDGLVRDRLVLLTSVGAWLVFVHTVGSGLVVTSSASLMVSVVGAMLLVLVLQGERLIRSGTAR